MRNISRWREGEMQNGKLFRARSLLQALGAELSEGSGSRIRIALNGRKAVFHRPHPRKETDKGALMSMKRLLVEAGVKSC